MAIDPDKFNSDPKHESERANFDKLLEGGLNRIGERKKKELEKNGPPAQKGFLDEILDMFTGDGK